MDLRLIDCVGGLPQAFQCAFRDLPALVDWAVSVEGVSAEEDCCDDGVGRRNTREEKAAQETGSRGVPTYPSSVGNEGTGKRSGPATAPRAKLRPPPPPQASPRPPPGAARILEALCNADLASVLRV
eukprot:GHVU01016690.1.p2 GENE.GHVU01016690.1~~GHVU01016690.1.p2  ORF type:complete len:127 (+),score=20.09 GHVU01016690.1:83-463(+)